MIYRNKKIKFKPLEIDDLKLIYNWFKVPEINQWYAQGKDWSMADIEAKYKPRLIGKEVVPSFIIELDSNEIGFIQYYPLSKTNMPEGLSFKDALQQKVDINTSVGIDLFIGDQPLIGHGLGKTIIRNFIKTVIPKNYITIFIDPSHSNVRAVKAYKKVGFKECPHQGNDNIWLMAVERDDLDIKVIDNPAMGQYDVCFTGCIILSHDKRILLQKRPDDWQTRPGYLTTFGGRIEKGETPAQAIVRELYEELGAQVSLNELIELGAVTEPCTGHTELVFEYFWHDKGNLITGCYEGIPAYFKDLGAVLNEPKKMDDIEWILAECRKRNLITN